MNIFDLEEVRYAFGPQEWVTFKRNGKRWDCTVIKIMRQYRIEDSLVPNEHNAVKIYNQCRK